MILTNGPQGKFTYTRKPGGQVESVTSNNTDGVSATYDYNGLNLIRSVTSGTQSYSLTYDAVGNPSYQSLPNGMGVTYVYDDLNRLTSLMVYNSSTTLASYAYNLGPTGNRLGVTEYGGRAVTWTPDDLYRLTQEDIGNDSVTGSIGYTMDNVGNRQTRSSNITAIPTQTFSGAYDLSDRCTATGFTWDANGNMLADLQGRTFTYDPLNRLTSVTGTGVAVSYVYNADNLRVKKINNITTVTTEYHWDTANVTGYPQVLEELEGGAVVCRYAYGPTGVLSQSRKVNGSWVTSYFGKDAQSVRFLMDESGNITDSWTWDAYGNLLGRTGAINCALGFDGDYMEPETDLVYLRARWYDPTTGRFLQMDSYEGDIQTIASMHKYSFSANDPINKADPSGKMFTVSDVGFAMACGSMLGASIWGVLAAFRGASPEEVVAQELLGFKIGASFGFGSSLMSKLIGQGFKTAGIGTSVALSQGLQSAQNTATYYSGGNGRAYEMARAWGGTILEDTKIGRILNQIPLRLPDFVWGKVSKIYAQNASGVVRVFISGSENPNSIWVRYEKDALLLNPKVNTVAVYYVETSLEPVFLKGGF